MSTVPWRGTLIFVGGIAAVAATSAARFAGADVVAVGTSSGSPAGAAGSTGAPAQAGSAGASAGSSGSSSSSDASTTNPGDSSSSSSADGSSSTSSDPTATPTAQPAEQSGVTTVVGSTVQTRYGPLQLSVTFDGSDITDVQALQYPDWHGESVQINQYAIPILTREAVAADSATIDAVSGATVTSQAYMTSLQAAIDQHG